MYVFALLRTVVPHKRVIKPFLHSSRQRAFLLLWNHYRLLLVFLTI